MRPLSLASILDDFRHRKSYAGELIGVTAKQPNHSDAFWTVNTHQGDAKIQVPGPAPSVFSEDRAVEKRFFREAKSFGRSSGGCSDATSVASTFEELRTDGGARPSTLLAQVRYVVPDVVIESFLNMQSDGLKAELQKSLHAS
jgi:hypothetical protein